MKLKSMYHFISIITAAFFVPASVFAADPGGTSKQVTGAGSTFVYPVLSKWADSYKKETGTSINYQSIGSGGGIKQIQSKTVDFGATDMPLKSEDLAKDGLVQFPIINGADVAVINVAGVKPGELKLSGDLLAQIFLGKIKKWNDPALVAVNKGLTLPDQAITVVHRSDGSGTSFIFTNYLSKVSADWKTAVGEGSAVNWPVGVGGKGNEGVASYVKQINGSIGYIEYAYALQNKMTYTQLQNQAGQFVTPEEKSFRAAAVGADWAHAKDYYLILTNAPGKTSWPLAGSTFVLMQKTQSDSAQGRAALQFFRWAFKNGEAAAAELHYVPLPKAVAALVEKTWKEQIKAADGKALAIGL